jgi:hypothetical protein
MHNDYNRIAREAVDWRLQPPDNGEPPQTRNVSGTLLHTLLTELAAASERYAMLKGVSDDSFDEAVLAPAFDVVAGVRSGLSDYSSRSKRIDHYDFWKHHVDPIALVEAKQHPYMDRQTIEDTVGDYLRQPVRGEVLDRLLVDLLIALEVYAFGHEMLNGPVVVWPSVGNPGGVYPPPLNTSFWWERLRVFFRFTGSYAAFSGLVLGVCWLSDYSIPLASLTLGAIYVLIASANAITSPFHYRKFRKTQVGIRDTIGASVHVYSLLGGHSVASATRIRDAVVDAARKGIVWPTSLYALLDNSIARRGLLRNW